MKYDDIILRYGRDQDGYPARPEAITQAWLDEHVSADGLADRMLTAITATVAAGQLPWDVADFCEMHNFVDANEFILEVLGLDMSDAGTELATIVTAIVDIRLRLAPASPTRNIRPSSLTWPHERHEQRREQRHLDPGRTGWPPTRSAAQKLGIVPMTCPRCGTRLESRGDFDGTGAGFGETYLCERGHWFALIQGTLWARLTGSEDSQPAPAHLFLGRWTREQLKAAFDLVKPAGHWKNQIDAIVPAGTDTVLVEDAIVFYTGSLAECVTLPDGSIRVQAAGYWASMGS